ncbi:hypothetical protein B0H16DRAFT_1474460 [Mycena metata]|uniref:Uncharacterized protein n=1 Tax=Mycena metata TaxID=1033252 RepID=A0AAD7HGX3_9AGAR|nr:hypothetical protein B0H16DRAFT_1474460 [Mycena metata]
MPENVEKVNKIFSGPSTRPSVRVLGLTLKWKTEGSRGNRDGDGDCASDQNTKWKDSRRGNKVHMRYTIQAMQAMLASKRTQEQRPRVRKLDANKRGQIRPKRGGRQSAPNGTGTARDSTHSEGGRRERERVKEREEKAKGRTSHRSGEYGGTRLLSGMDEYGYDAGHSRARGREVRWDENEGTRHGNMIMRLYDKKGCPDIDAGMRCTGPGTRWTGPGPPPDRRRVRTISAVRGVAGSITMVKHERDRCNIEGSGARKQHENATSANPQALTRWTGQGVLPVHTPAQSVWEGKRGGMQRIASKRPAKRTRQPHVNTGMPQKDVEIGCPSTQTTAAPAITPADGGAAQTGPVKKWDAKKKIKGGDELRKWHTGGTKKLGVYPSIGQTQCDAGLSPATAGIQKARNVPYALPRRHWEREGKAAPACLLPGVVSYAGDRNRMEGLPQKGGKLTGETQSAYACPPRRPECFAMSPMIHTSVSEYGRILLADVAAFGRVDRVMGPFQGALGVLWRDFNTFEWLERSDSYVAKMAFGAVPRVLRLCTESRSIHKYAVGGGERENGGRAQASSTRGGSEK